MAHGFNSSTREAEAGEFETSLVYKVQGSQDSVIQGNHVSTPSCLKEPPSWAPEVLGKFVVCLSCPMGG